MKRLVHAAVVFSLLLSTVLFAQVDQQYWHFGSTNRGLFFDASSGYAVSVTNNSYTPYGNEGSTTVSDPITGVLKFYSDAMTVVDNTHQAMPNGSGLLGHSSNFSSGKSCQVPGQCDQYYIFSVNTALEVAAPGALRYSIVDMTLPGNGSIGVPKGDVVVGQKNILIGNNVSESLEIVPKANSHEFWLLVGKQGMVGMTSIDIYDISVGGISFHNSYVIPVAMNNIVCMDHCQENGKVALLSMQEVYPTLLSDFNNVTGFFTATSIIPGTPWGGSTLNWQGTFDAEWSPDGTKLYISKYRWGATSGGRLYQYDLNTPLVPPVMIHSVGTSNAAVARGIKLAPDGKIYMMYKPATGASQFLHVVNNPNAAGVACSFVPNVINMGIDLGISHLFPDFLYYQNSLPQIPDSIFTYNCQLPGIISFDPLLGYSDNESDNLSFTINSAIGGTYNVIGSTLNFTPDPVFVGDPQIQIIYTDDYCFPLSDTFTIELKVVAGMGTLTLPDSLLACIGSSVQLDAGAGFNSYLWSTGEITQTIDVDASGLYKVQTTDGICNYEDSTFVQFNPPTLISLGPDQTVCADSLELSIGAFLGTVNWSDGETGNSNWVVNSGQYSVIAENSSGCLSYDTIDIVINPLPVIDLGPTIDACSYDEIYLEAIGYSSVLWSDGSTNDSLFITNTGNYHVTVTNSFGCQITDFVQVNIAVPDQVSLGPDTLVCATSYNISSNGFNGTIHWSNDFSGASYNVSTSGIYSVIANDVNGCLSYDTITVFLAPIPSINLGNDTTVCPGELTLYATGFTTVAWNSGSSDSSINIMDSGIYSVEVTNSYGCVSDDVIEISVVDVSLFALGPDIETCNENEVTIQTGVDHGNFLWSTGEKTNQITVDETGEYIVEQSVCGLLFRDTLFVTITTLDQVVYIPNAFTPDGNFLNNEFEIVIGDYSHILNYSLSIYNRWGNLVFSTTDPYAKWNGAFTQGLVLDGIYIYEIKIETDCLENEYWTKYGHITVLK